MLVFELDDRNIEWYLRTPLPDISVSEIEAIQAEEDELDIILTFMEGNSDSIQVFEGSDIPKIWKSIGGTND
jgi:hypothetical protein